MTSQTGTARCTADGCGRALRDPISVRIGMGPVCRARAGIVVVAVDRVTSRAGGVLPARPGHVIGQLELELGIPDTPKT